MTHKLTRLLALMLAVVMSFSMLLIPAQAASFTDVSDSAWYAAAVDYVNERGWMAGVSESSFAPGKEVTRGMMVTVLARLAEADTDNETAAFADTAAGKWYTGAAAWAAQNGIVAGVGNGRFSPNRAITRQDLCTMLYAYVQAMGIELKNDVDRTFSDMDSVSGYAREAVIYCTGTGLIAGFDDSTFRPKDTATRAQLAQILMRLDLLVNGEEAPTDPMPAQSFSGEAGEDMSVSVNAPEGALPENTEMTLSRVTSKVTMDAIREKVAGNILAAADITFSKNGAELEPAADVEVQISLEGLSDAASPKVFHIKSDGTVEPVDSGLVYVNRGGEKALRFYSKSFSVYVIVDDDDGNSGTDRGTVNFYGISDKINNASPELEYSSSPRASYTIKNDDEYLEPDEDYDETISYINDIVSDPGIGVEITSNTLFLGWCITDDPSAITLETEALSIEGVWEELGKLTQANSLDNTTVINIYPVVVKYFNITYYGNDTSVSLGTKTETLLVNDESTVHTVNMSYTPASNQDFKGWKPSEQTDGNILNVVVPSEEEGGEPTYTAKPSDSVYANDTEILIKGHVVFYLEAPEGVWLVYNTNGKGGTYNAPQFYLKGAEITPHETAAASEMTRKGYQFKGWYVIKEGHTPTADANGNYTIVDNDPDFESFSFTNADGTKKTISEDTYIYARWDANTTAQYTVLFWRQNVNGWETNTDGTYDKTKPIYDFLKENEEGTVVYTISGTADVGATITAALNGNNVRISVDNSTLADQNIDKAIPTGCHFEKADPAAGITVSLTENNVLNVYFDRDEYTLTFHTGTPAVQYKTTSGYRLVRVRSESGYNTSYTYAIQIDGVWHQITSEGRYVWDASSISGVDSNRYITYTYYGREYSDAQYASSTYTIPADSTLIYTINALYEQNISSHFPIHGTNNIIYENGERWKAQEPTHGYDEVIVWIDTMPDGDICFVSDTNDNATGATMYYYVEALPTDTDTVTFEGTKYVLYTDEPVEAQYNFVTIEDYLELTGFTKHVAANADGTHLGTYSNDNVKNYYGTSQNNKVLQVYFYYSRNAFPINYMDGIYVNGNGQTITTETNQGQLDTTASLLYCADLTQYNKTVKNDEDEDVPGTEFFDPTARMLQIDSNFGYEFAGWYIDSSCTTPYTFTTMPDGGITVYAKWQLKQYRAYLHPNVPVPASTSGSYDPKTYVSWGDETKPADDKQQFNFRIDFGKKISLPTGVVRGYEFVGWFTDPEFKHVYTPSTEFNDKTITTPYDQTDATDLMDKFGQIVPYGWQEGDDDPYGVKGHVYISNEDRGVPESAAATNFNADAQKNRTWITKRLDLYAQWRVAVIGAPGINIRYSAIDTTGEVDDDGNVGTINGHFADGTDTEMMDPQYYVDTATAVSLPASVPPADTDYLFDCWVLQTWDATAGDYVDLKDDNGNLVTVYPGAGFGVYAKYAKIVLVGSDPEQVVALADVVDSPDVKYTYTIQLRAEYKEKYAEKDTHVYWYANNGTDEKQENNGLKINQPVDIPTPDEWRNGDVNPVVNSDDEGGDTGNAGGNEAAGETDGEGADEGEENEQVSAGLTYEGYNFLGWARILKDGDVYKVDNGTAALYEIVPDSDGIFNLTEADLWLKWVEEPGQEGEYYAKDASGNWTIDAAQVACDEAQPYHDLYAVWHTASFYVFHSATGKLEAYNYNEAKKKGDTFNLVDLVPEGYLYGGYYTSYGGLNVTQEGESTYTVADLIASQYDKSNADYKLSDAASLSWTKTSEALSYVDLGASEIKSLTGYEAYSGDKMKIDSNERRFWTRANAYGYAALDDAASGDTLVPESGMVYYLKEVPETYLTTKYVYTYDKNNNNEIQSFFMMTVVDDTYYSQIGFHKVNNAGTQAEAQGGDLLPRQTVARKIIISQQNGESEIEVTAENFGKTAGYVAVLKNDDYVAANNSFSVMPCWQTYDKVEVFSHGALKLTVNNDKTAITWESLPGSTVSTPKTTFYVALDDSFKDDYLGIEGSDQYAATWLYFYNNNSNPTKELWVEAAAVDGTDNSLWMATFPEGDWNGVIVVRGDPNATSPSWDSMYNQTNDICPSYPDTFNNLGPINLVTLNGYNDGKLVVESTGVYGATP